ncbi:MAG: NAD(P)H-dependent oxidoreductase [Gemmatimonadota bacterium]|nr:NAD(P)H-dependent oxidoreductase [Gemmatimonadota bacterium]MDH3366742.1 NAD(P)H-dependent oxidoreductase [Gemmatimonadota bacterium]MDH3478827.1 NAD(P)H-dependent oxidoreductase [Gemmatimonadota bacterium]MDH3569031.1 NAD(P)H-dependent oxidoreductase [Gemmatimonadota bacterium]MDH5550146.1 NAD(P)H-dependent oxidoreductase [Gemmatimonadota bacterium]
MRAIVSISATSRPDNYTARALAVVNDELERREVSPTVFDARELSLSFPGHPPTDDAKRLQAAIEGAGGVVIGTPEYHGGFSAMTKLIIENLGFPSALAGKPVALVGVAAGRIGAIKSLEQLRGVCSHVGAIVLPGAVSVAGVRAAFDEAGHCTDEGVEDALRGIAGSLLEFIENYICPKYALEAMVRGEDTPWTSTI